MKLLELVLYQSCNYACADCPMAKWLYEPDAVDGNGNKLNRIDNTTLLAWIDKYLNPKEWFIEITGGEPAMYPEIFELIKELRGRRYKGLIRTNGSLPLPSEGGFKRAAAWHKAAAEFPKYFDYIQILQNPDDDWEAKIEYCKEHNIPYCVFPYKTFSKGCTEVVSDEPKISRLFTEMTVIFSSGVIGGCFKGNVKGKNIFDMDEPEIFTICKRCTNIESLDYFILNAPGFREAFKIADEDITPHVSWIVYPMLDRNSNWVLEDGTVVGRLGDDLDSINAAHKKEVVK